MHETNELLLEGIPGSLTPEQEQLVRLNQASNASLSRMVADLLDLSRLQGGAMTYRFGRHDLGQLARDGVRDLVGVAHARKIRVDVEAPVAPVWVECDETLLLRAIENLVTNAIRYSPNGGCVRVEVGPARGGTATLKVEDQGRGIPNEHKQRVFDRFYRVDSKRKGGLGTGIGLAIVKSIAEGHRGSIRVEDAAGGGSRFVIELPGAVTARADTPPAERAVTGGAT
jgi:signal transduction histidine kinase